MSSFGKTAASSLMATSTTTTSKPLYNLTSTSPPSPFSPENYTLSETSSSSIATRPTAYQTVSSETSSFSGGTKRMSQPSPHLSSTVSGFATFSTPTSLEITSQSSPSGKICKKIEQR